MRACVCLCACCVCVCVSSRAACDELPAVFAATVFASFSSSTSSPSRLCLSVQSGNVDHRGLTHRCRVSLHLQTALLRFWVVFFVLSLTARSLPTTALAQR